MRVPASLRSTRANTYSISRLTPAGAWTYAGSCYQSEGDTWLAAAAHACGGSGVIFDDLPFANVGFEMMVTVSESCLDLFDLSLNLPSPEC